MNFEKKKKTQINCKFTRLIDLWSTLAPHFKLVVETRAYQPSVSIRSVSLSKNVKIIKVE